MIKYTSLAVLTNEEIGYSVFFYDFKECITEGDTFDEAIDMAKDALGLHLYGLIKDGDNILEPTKVEDIDLIRYEKELGEKFLLIPITVYPNMVKDEIENKAVKKTLTIPYWLNEIAEKEKVNFSQILQSALKEYLGVKNR